MESALSASRRIDGYGGGEGGLGGGGDDDVHADAAHGDMICNNGGYVGAWGPWEKKKR